MTVFHWSGNLLPTLEGRPGHLWGGSNSSALTSLTLPLPSICCLTHLDTPHGVYLWPLDTSITIHLRRQAGSNFIMLHILHDVRRITSFSYVSAKGEVQFQGIYFPWYLFMYPQRLLWRIEPMPIHPILSISLELTLLNSFMTSLRYAELANALLVPGSWTHLHSHGHRQWFVSVVMVTSIPRKIGWSRSENEVEVVNNHCWWLVEKALHESRRWGVALLLYKRICTNLLEVAGKSRALQSWTPELPVVLCAPSLWGPVRVLALCALVLFVAVCCSWLRLVHSINDPHFVPRKTNRARPQFMSLNLCHQLLQEKLMDCRTHSIAVTFYSRQ